MQYRENPKNGDKLSILGFGAMRLNADEQTQQKLISYAVENGINYFDTAYIYPGNEAALGRALAKGYRSRVKIATKMPHYLIKKYADLDKIFNTQLQRLQTDYVDYYLIHTLNDAYIWQRLVELGLLEWIEENKKQGRILNIGFSYHGGREEFINVLDAYDWEFCLIQYNYLDEQRQAGRSGLEYAAAKGVPVMVMEPLRGGLLVDKLPKQARSVWDNAAPRRSPAEWGLRFVWNHPGVSLLLSGMNSLQMLKENIAVANEVRIASLSQRELELFDKVKQVLNSNNTIPCTGCNYCLPCPRGVDIPTCFSCYNDRELVGKISARQGYIMQTTMKKRSFNASQCVQCGKCEERCPQNISIRKELARVIKALEGFYYRPISFIMKKFMKL
ncbi:MAG: aldo/keto reductase [Clostridiales bacterium]|nr:aldo/keto reductase [Clostridiales bacterium]